MKLKRNVLIVGKEIADSVREQLINYFFDSDHWKAVFVESIAEAINEFDNFYLWHLYVIAFDMAESPDRNGLHLLEYIQDKDYNTPIYLLGPTKTGKHGFPAHIISHYPRIIGILDFNRINDACALFQSDYNKYMAQCCSPQVYSEFETLRTVLVHEPSKEIGYIPRGKYKEYLFRDIQRIDIMKKQHKEFVNCIKKAAYRPIVLDTALLLQDVIDALKQNYSKNDDDDFVYFIKRILFAGDIWNMMAAFGKSRILSDWLHDKVKALCDIPSDDLVRRLLCGYRLQDFPSTKTIPEDPRTPVVEPVPNTYFTRDPCFVLGNLLFLSSMSKPIRRRETAILREIIEHHPFMVNAKKHFVDILNLGHGYLVEGGDAMAIRRGEYAIASSERTNRQTAEEISRILMRHDNANLVYQPMIPAHPDCIHLDTVCSLVGENCVAVYQEAFDRYSLTSIWDRQTGDQPHRGSFKDILLNHYKKIPMPVDFLEQRDDGTNVLMATANAAIVYDRNRNINAKLKDNGINLFEFSGDELLKGDGGPRCMSMPLRRGA